MLTKKQKIGLKVVSIVINTVIAIRNARKELSATKSVSRLGVRKRRRNWGKK